MTQCSIRTGIAVLLVLLGLSATAHAQTCEPECENKKSDPGEDGCDPAPEPARFHDKNGNLIGTATVTWSHSVTNGRCAPGTLDPPYSHLWDCLGYVKCKNTTKITVIFRDLHPTKEMQVNMSAAGTICNVGHSAPGSHGGLGNETWDAFDGVTYQVCGDGPCPVDVTYTISTHLHELGGDPEFYDDTETLSLQMTYDCTKCKKLTGF